MTEPTMRVTSVDDWQPGLRFSVKALNTRSVKRASRPGDVLPVCLAHNLRQGNQDHRHRRRIDPDRSSLNEVWAGPDRLDVAVALVRDTLEALDIEPRRRDAIMGVELVFQPPYGIELHPFWAACMTWAQSRFEHIVSATVHHDQKRPHMHVLALAISGGRLAGNEMTASPHRPKQRRADFMAFMRQTLGLRPDRKVKTLGDIAASHGKGPKTRAEAEKREARMGGARPEVGVGVHGLGGSQPEPINPHSPQPPVIAHLSHHDKVRLLWALVADLRVTPASPLEPPPKPVQADTQEASAIRVRDDEMPAEWWDAESGEFRPHSKPQKPQKAAAEAWVRAALHRIGSDAQSLP
jgi:hypothetical protein